MLSVRPKITELNFSLFARSVHPELFEVCVSRTFVREQYQLTLNITRDGHTACFQNDRCLLTEISASALHPLPTQQMLISHSIQHPSKHTTSYQNVVFRSKVEMESVHPSVFVTIQQQLNEQLEVEGLVHRFESNGRIAFGAISYMNVQSFQKHVLVRSFHTFPDTCTVMKSESRFSII